ncbi:MAG: hypothetical protein ACJAWH_000734 [Maribacter sp.]|jgi:hypothetical protein
MEVKLLTLAVVVPRLSPLSAFKFRFSTKLALTGLNGILLIVISPVPVIVKTPR